MFVAVAGAKEVALIFGADQLQEIGRVRFESLIEFLGGFEADACGFSWRNGGPQGQCEVVDKDVEIWVDRLARSAASST